jgi:hypothetical protein
MTGGRDHGKGPDIGEFLRREGVETSFQQVKGKF